MHQTIASEQSVGQLCITGTKQGICAWSIQQTQQRISEAGTNENNLYN